MNWGSVISMVVTLLGSTSVLAGLQCVFAHAGTDLGSHWHECLALITGGSAVASPGVNALKAGIFARPKAQQSKDPLTGEKR